MTDRGCADLTSAERGLKGHESTGHQNLEALAEVFDRPLPVLGCLSAGHELELIGGEPCTVVEHTGAFGAHLELVQVEHGLVGAALHVDDHVLPTYVHGHGTVGR